MSILLAKNSSNKILFGSASGLDDLDPYTMLLWIYPTDLTALAANIGVLLFKDLPTQFFVRDTGALVAWRNRATTRSDAETAGGYITTNVWQMIACVFNSAGAAGQIMRLYRGTLTALAAEASYASQVDGAGVLNSDAAAELELGNASAYGNFNAAIRFATVGVVARALSLAEIRDWQFNPRPGAGARLFSHLGYNGTGTQPDWSGNGNAGTLTGGSVAAHVPLALPFGDVLSKAPASQIVGTLSQTLGALTSTATGTVQLKATSAPTLAALTSTTTGKVQIKGAASPTLGALTSTATGTVQVKGAAGVTLGTLASTAAGTVQVKAALAKTLAALTLSATSGAGAQGTLSKTLGALTLAATGAIPVKGTLSQMLAALADVSAGTVQVKGTAGLTLAALTGLAAGKIPVKGTTGATLAALTLLANNAALSPTPASRVFEVTQENRILDIPNEARVFTVALERRIYTIEG